jgi:hypothetical protein
LVLPALGLAKAASRIFAFVSAETFLSLFQVLPKKKPSGIHSSFWRRRLRLPSVTHFLFKPDIVFDLFLLTSSKFAGNLNSCPSLQLDLQIGMI